MDRKESSQSERGEKLYRTPSLMGNYVPSLWPLALEIPMLASPVFDL